MSQEVETPQYPGTPRTCPYCGALLTYRPRTHWTGMRSIIIDHIWVCVTDAEPNGARHYFERTEKA